MIYANLNNYIEENVHTFITPIVQAMNGKKNLRRKKRAYIERDCEHANGMLMND